MNAPKNERTCLCVNLLKTSEVSSKCSLVGDVVLSCQLMAI